ncbi:hypothetical protein ACHHYP_15478 [Achlya hypogyna]|uniref:General transcription factor 3C polypeptide 5 n=1 Tax=Achlya hypogyna TaxID=1202772 RepID=A0A1V9YAT0_ACHHY|nr:hypothetical protein ACHHYP_15478 [Achlya hypogyna]
MTEPRPTMTLEVPSQEAVCVEMPLLFKDPTKAPMYFGGIPNLVTIQETKTPFLPIKLRPGEPNCKPIFADRAKTQTFVLAVSKSKKRPSEPATAAITAVATEKFVCEGMADYQYFAAPKYLACMDAPPAKRLEVYRSVSHLEDLELVPEVFSRVDLPLKYEFKQRPQFKPKTEGDETAPVTKTNGRGVQYVNFRSDKDVPQFKGPDHMPKTRGIPIELEEHVLNFIRRKFEERPIWQRHTLFENSSAAERRVALRFLPFMCYIFLNGPWRGMWVRMGYDPRTTPSSAPYQMLEIRGNRELVHATVSRTVKTHQKKVTRFRYTSRLTTVVQSMDAEDDVALHFKQKKRHNRSKTTVKMSSSTAVGDNDDDSPAHLIYGLPLSTGYFHIQLCDLREKNEGINECMNHFDNRLRASASILTGWYPTCMFPVLREKLRHHIATVVGRPQDELLLREKQIQSLERTMMEELEARGDVDSDENNKKTAAGAGESDDEMDEPSADEATADDATADEDDEEDDEEETKCDP